MRGESAEFARYRETTRTSPSSAACGRQLPPRGKPLELAAAPRGKPLKLTGAFSPWGRRCPRPRPRTDEGRACGCCPLKGGYANSALISRLRAAASPDGEAFRTGGSPSGKPLGLTGAFSPWGRRCPRLRPRTDEGRACGGCPLKGGYANFALISRLRAAASVYALRAAFGGCAPTRACGRSPSGEAFRTGGSPSGEAFKE